MSTTDVIERCAEVGRFRIRYLEAGRQAADAFVRRMVVEFLNKSAL